MARLTKKKVGQIKRRKELGLSSKLIARQLGVTERRINQVWANIRIKGYCILKKPGKEAKRKVTKKEKLLILYTAKHQRMGARIVGKLLRYRHNIKIGNNLIHSTLLNNSMATTNEKKRKRRKPWVRYERKHSLSAGHTDWHTTKWRLGLQVCTIIDDSSRKILAAIECRNATEKESTKLVQSVLDEYGHIRRIREIISDHGSQFYCNKNDKHGVRGKAEFEKFLEKQGIKHILCRYKHPQTNGKQEKWFDVYEKYRKDFNSMEEFVKWYNEVRVHESLDLRTPEKVFWERLQPFTLEAAGKFLRRVDK
tara:strand:+ start:90 stop:1016 length:927 start_codon:yes stop_codon:yes gene_type:complete